MKYIIKIWNLDEFVGWVSKNLTVTYSRDNMLVLDAIPVLELSDPNYPDYEFIFEELFESMK